MSSALCMFLVFMFYCALNEKKTKELALQHVFTTKNTMLIQFSLRSMCNFPFAKFMYGFTKPYNRNRFGHMTSIDCQLAKLTSSYFWAERLFCLDLSINKWIFGFIYTILFFVNSNSFSINPPKRNEMKWFVFIKTKWNSSCFVPDSSNFLWLSGFR